MNDIFDVIIIGSGPAGLTAGIYTTRASLSTLIIGGTAWGGQLMLTTEVENFPGFPEGIMGPELIGKIRKQAERFGAVFKEEDVESVDFEVVGDFRVVGDGEQYKGRSIIIATGAQTQWLNLPTEKRLIGRGVSSCAPCDAPFFKEKEVIVVGGGDSAMEEALVLSRFATSVKIVHRRNAFRASEIMQKKVFDNPKISVIWNSEVVDILGEEKVTGVKLKDVGTGETKEVRIDGVFVAIGHKPATEIYSGQVELDEKEYIKVYDHTRTSKVGVFVAGDVHDYRYKQAITAAAFGCMAAMDAEKWLEERKS
ncbi:MAG: thioredoxin-disulfide reductase [Candidatus Blackburnbacteria bacterium]|nr:thioredoxin-disulfide reductase [Candidatus Blackburnbacteria bacterium]